ncbi:phage tail protein I [Arcobacter cryaerophilus gv. pseudocryaerophilus]|uniref:Phage tail protein I n=3 Tax=unclassified Arcobacter TaxID=2593671 RepID=A0AA96L404_9BACT|nr:phage tail protein I [Arcobacter sp. AZ-2023]WPD04715.1 phage tail protein I [Arcobacter sp. DSM 115956]WPD06810.1 phage tail protein I [Arcobacter sp. DSM 115955]WNL31075.1 phage tail protein I [Arcobacter sp. AZ-2023]WNP37225.1 phage tail protein I [Arcobacter sp. AZ-2023]
MISISLLPQSEDSKLKAIDLAYETRVAKIKQELQVVSTLAQPKRADERFLPYLAHSHQVAFWSNDLTLDEKRAIIDFSIHLHRKKGTLFALKEVLKRLNIDVKFYEWFEYQGLPYHFKIDVDFISRPAGIEELKLIEEFIEIYKNEKSVLELISVKLRSDLIEKVASVTITGEEIEVLPFVTRNLLSNTGLERVFASSIASERIEVKPYVVKDFIFINKQKQAIAVKESEKITLKLIIGDI